MRLGAIEEVQGQHTRRLVQYAEELSQIRAAQVQHEDVSLSIVAAQRLHGQQLDHLAQQLDAIRDTVASTSEIASDASVKVLAFSR